ncbi:mechanosensitive ion channel family protein [Deminuibacter soli]|uniref:Mechanosensitive ion channel family protein n=1 Tax=Deminuibacter soli TaxID=2291815 RepID=A0A3E1NHJ1_9BACT|nr:mechanosensitive ion channel family protein [Deminuibacter soli]RFM27324.1 mechanosensitive ion channel family protein [Deminuibacter soli]
MKPLNHISIVLLWQTLVLVGGALYAQQDTAVKGGDSSKQRDSIHNVVLVNQGAELDSLGRRLQADAVREAELKQEISRLNNTDHEKRESLLKELGLLRSATSGRSLLLKQKADSLRPTVKGFGVAPFGDTLLYVYAKLGSFSPQERAAAISERLRRIAEDYRYNADSFTVVHSELTTDVVYKTTTVTSIADNDAWWFNDKKDSLATAYKNKMALAVLQYRKENSWPTLLREILLALLVLAVLGGVMFVVSRLFRRTRLWIMQQQGTRLTGFKLKNYEIFDAKREVAFLVVLNKWVKWMVILVLIYIALPILFGIFPRTEDFAHTLFSYILNPVKRVLHAIWNYLPNFFTIVVLVIVFRYLVKGVCFLKTEIEKGILKIPGFYADWANPTYQIIRILLLAFMLVVIFPYLPGSDSPIFKGISVFLGVLFTFGSAGALGNVVAGLVLTYMRAFKTGDRVKIGDAVGDVVEKSILVTRIRTIKNEIISIPNATVMNSFTTNYSSDAPDRGLIIHTTLTIGYDTPWQKIQELMIAAADITTYIEKEPRPFVLQTSLDDYYISYQVNAYTREPNRQATIYSELHQHLLDVFNEAGVEIMSPHYTSLRDGSKSTIPRES